MMSATAEYAYLVAYKSRICVIYDWVLHTRREVVLSDIGRRPSCPPADGDAAIAEEAMPPDPPTVIRGRTARYHVGPQAKRICQHLHECGPSSVEQLQTALGLQAAGIRQHLRRHDGVLWQRAGRGRGQRRAEIWAEI